jgi:hypothetical protein
VRIQRAAAGSPIDRVSEVQERTAVLNSGVVYHEVDGADFALDVFSGGRHLLR